MSNPQGLLQTRPPHRGRSVAELRERAKQWMATWSERMRISSQARIPDDAAFARELCPTWAASTGAALDRFRARSTPRFFAAFGGPAQVVAALRTRWPEFEERVVATADRIRCGQFDLLGHRLDFGSPIDWHYDPVSGARPGGGRGVVHWSRIAYLNPQVAGDYKRIWELNRHQYFTTLGKAYWYTGDEGYASTLVEHLMAWMDANPPTRGINWASSLEVAFRAVSWIWGLYFLKTSSRLTPSAFLRVLKFLYLHGRHIETFLSTYYSPNTHLTGEALGLVYLGTLFPEFRCAARWRRVGWAILVDQLGKQVLSDGTYFEQSTYYHRYTTDFCLHLSILGQLNDPPVASAIRGTLRALLDHLMHITQPDGSTPLVGDDDGGRTLVLDGRAPHDFRAALATGAVLFQRRDYRFVAGEAAEETLWLLGVEGLRAFDALEAVPPSGMSRAFPDGGYYVMRDGWHRDASTMLIDGGRHGAMNCGHAHADALGFTLVVGGRAVLVDPGTYTYTAPAAQRDRFRSSAAHNTVTVAGESSSVPRGPFKWQHIGHAAVTAWEAGLRCDAFAAVHDGYARLQPPALHRRAVLFLKGDYWIVRDRIVTDGDHDVTLHLHFAPGIAVHIPSPTRAVGLWGRDSRCEALDVAVFSEAGTGVMRGGTDWVSTSYGSVSSAHACAFTAGGAGPRDLVTFLVPREAADDPVEIQEQPASNGRAFRVVRAGIEDLLLLGGDGDVASGDGCTDAAWAWVRKAPGEALPREFGLIQGQSLRWRGHALVQAHATVTRLAARLEGSDLHVEVPPLRRCVVDSLGADRVVVNGVVAVGASLTAVAGCATAPVTVSCD